jgi:hypothetical protein
MPRRFFLFIKNKHKRIRLLQKKFSFLLILFSFFACSIQSLPDNIQIDSLLQTVKLSSDSTQLLLLNNNDEFLNYRINSLLINNIPDSMSLQLHIDSLSHNFNSENIFESSMSDQWRINEQLNNYVQFQNRLTMKSDLGVFGKVLNHSRNLTAIILAIIHIIKYKKGLY